MAGVAESDLSRELENLREQQRALGNVLRAVARSAGLQPVLDEVVEAATRLCEGDNGRMWLVKNDLLHAVANGGVAEGFDYDQEHPHVLDLSTASGRAALTRAVVHIPDVEADPAYAYSGPRPFRANLSVPILLDDELIGVIGLTRAVPEGFTDEQITLVKTFADQAAIAIKNARLMDAVERQLEQQRAISDVLRAVARSEGLQPVLDEVIATTTRFCAGDFGTLYVLEGELLHALSSSGQLETWEYDKNHPHKIDRTTVVGRAALTRAPAHIPDVLEDPEYTYAGPRAGYRALLGVPILAEHDLIGAMTIVRTVAEPFSEDEIELVKTFADQAAIAIANARLIDAVERQRTELSRFVSPQVAELLSSDEGEAMLAGHRAYISCLFCDLRGFTSFTETAEPEELFEVLREYHTALGELIPAYHGTLEHFAGDGLMVFFNDPLPVEQHELKAVRLALAAQERFEELAANWRKRGTELGLGIGISAGYATLGRIGFEGRYDYGALGPATNLASRLSTHAELGQTLISQRVFAAVEEGVDAEPVGELELKGFGRPVVAYEVRSVVESGP